MFTQYLLGLQAPFMELRMNLDADGQRVGVWAAQMEDVSWADPQCAKNLPRAAQAAEQTWTT